MAAHDAPNDPTPVPAHVFAVWGDLHDPDSHVAYRRTVDDSNVLLSFDRAFASFDIGPAALTGPVVYSSEPHDGDHGDVVVLVDEVVPRWVTDMTLGDWGWVPALHLPTPVDQLSQVDVLLVARGWRGELDGWSSSQFLNLAVLPLQRIALPVSPGGIDTFEVHVLEVGQDNHGMKYVIVYLPDRTELERINLEAHAWRREPSLRVRRHAWSMLADLSERAEAIVETVLRSPILVKVELRGDRELNPDAVALLPDSLQLTLQDSVEANRTRRWL